MRMCLRHLPPRSSTNQPNRTQHMLIISHHLLPSTDQPTNYPTERPTDRPNNTHTYLPPCLSTHTERADSIRNNGCFDATGLVETPNGQVQISDLQTNDMVLTMNSITGQLQFSPFLMWLDRDDSAEELFVELTTKSNRVIRLTSSHLIYLADEPIDLTPQAQTRRQSPPSSPVAAAAVAATFDVGSHQANNNNNDSKNYYQYALDDGAVAAAAAVNESGQTNGPATIVPVGDVVVAIDQQQQQQLPKITSSLPRGQQRPPTIDEIAYTTYARNSLVGQYLLINDNDPANQDQDQDQEQSFNDDDNPGGDNTSDGDGDDDDAVASYAQQASTIVGAAADSARYRYDVIPDDEQRTASRLVVVPSKERESSTHQIRQPKSTVKFDQIVSVNFVTRSGRFAPLTREGNIIVNSVVASCYAVISDHDMAHLSFAPVRWLSYLQEWLFGIEPPRRGGGAQTRLQTDDGDTEDRTNLPTTTTSYELFDTQQQLPKSESRWTRTRELGTRSTETQKIRPIGQQQQQQQRVVGVHWYPQLLYRIARYILPTRFLY